MPARNPIERLAAAWRPLLSAADTLVGTAEEDRILEQILASSRNGGATLPAIPRLRAGVLLAAVASVAAIALVATGVLGRSSPSGGGGHRHLALSGAKLELAGYRFKTPAGFKASSRSCIGTPSDLTPVLNGFVAAASAEGGCVEAASELIGGDSSTVPSGADPVGVGAYQGYLVTQDGSDESTLYVELPHAGGDLVLLAKGLTRDQLIAVAESGLPTLPLRPTTTTG